MAVLLRFTDGRVVAPSRCPQGIQASSHWRLDPDAADRGDEVNTICRCEPFPDEAVPAEPAFVGTGVVDLGQGHAVEVAFTLVEDVNQLPPRHAHRVAFGVERSEAAERLAGEHTPAVIQAAYGGGWDVYQLVGAA